MDEMPKFYEPEELSRLQQMELSILRDFIKICDANGLHYFAIAGTVLGGVRHGGYIPWDDDIDIALPRKDYERFLRIVEKTMSDRYYILNTEHDPRFPLATTRLCIKGTKFVEKAFMDLECPFGIFLDIYAFDNLADNKLLYNLQIWEAWFWSKLLILRNIRKPFLFQKGLAAKLIWWVCGLTHDFMCALRISPTWLYKRCMKACKRYNHCRTKRFGYPCDTDPRWSVFEKTSVFPTQKYKFEDLSLNFPKDTNGMLLRYYGETYMQLPPEEKRKTHYPYILDFGDGMTRREQ